MKVTADIRRTDLIAMNWFFLFRLRINAITFVILFAGASILSLWLRPRIAANDILIASGIGFSAALCGMIIGIIFSLIFLLATASKKSGLLGPRTYSLRDEGLFTEGVSGEGLIRWHAIHSVRTAQNYLYIGVTATCFLIVPGRAFASREAFAGFANRAHALWKTASDELAV